MKTFEELWNYQQGAVFLKQDEIYALRKDLARYFYEQGYKQGREDLTDYLDLEDKVNDDSR